VTGQSPPSFFRHGAPPVITTHSRGYNHPHRGITTHAGGITSHRWEIDPRSAEDTLEPVFDVDHDSGLRIGSYQQDFLRYLLKGSKVNVPVRLLFIDLAQAELVERETCEQKAICRIMHVTLAIL